MFNTASEHKTTEFQGHVITSAFSTNEDKRTEIQPTSLCCHINYDAYIPDNKRENHMSAR